jgi:hypothetical protein
MALKVEKYERREQQSDIKKVQIVLNWTSNEEKEGVWSDEMKKNTITLEVERIGYEHKL